MKQYLYLKQIGVANIDRCCLSFIW